jgi:hypothetical protein
MSMVYYTEIPKYLDKSLRSSYPRQMKQSQLWDSHQLNKLQPWKNAGKILEPPVNAPIALIT